MPQPRRSPRPRRGSAACTGCGTRSRDMPLKTPGRPRQWSPWKWVMQIRVMSRGRDPGVDHLPLGALARVEEQALAVPAQQVAVVVAGPGGHLAGGAEDDEFAHGTECPTLHCRV